LYLFHGISLLLAGIHAGKLSWGCTSAGALHVSILRLKPSVTVPANMFLETKNAGDM
jgi:hypothetical protein